MSSAREQIMDSGETKEQAVLLSFTVRLMEHGSDKRPNLSGTELERFLEGVLRAAESGAREVHPDPQLVSEAAEAAVEKYEDAVLTGKGISNPGAWAFRVGRHEALRLVKKGRAMPLGTEDPAVSRLNDREELALPPLTQLEQMLSKHGRSLTERQEQAVRAVLRHKSLKAAARAIHRDPSAFRRLFSRALARLRSSGRSS